MAKLTKATVEDARQRAGIESDMLCLGGQVVVPLLRELKPQLVELAKDAVPGWLRWLPFVGGVVGSVVDSLIGALESWTYDACEESGP